MRRIEAVERSLGPQDVVLQILAEARQFAGLEAYTRWIIDQPEEAAPLKLRDAKNGNSRYNERVAERVQTLADNARIATFDRLGENRRALWIVEGRLASR